MSEIIVLGNLIVKPGAWKSPQTGRVYSVNGICPTLNACSGGAS